MAYAILRDRGVIRIRIRASLAGRTRTRRRASLGPMRVTRPASAHSSGARASLADQERWRLASLRENWYCFLAEEIKGPEGLLCFYDRPRTARVEERCRRIFAAWLGCKKPTTQAAKQVF